MKTYMDKNIIFLSILGAVGFLCGYAVLQTEGYNADRGILKWNPSWLSNSRYSEPVSYYGGMSRSSSGLPKRLGERSSLYGSNQIYKWSPVYFSDRGLFGKTGGGSRYLNVISNDGFDSEDK